MSTSASIDILCSIVTFYVVLSIIMTITFLVIFFIKAEIVVKLRVQV